MAYLYRPVAVKPVPKSATVGTHGGKRVARWTARGGKPVVAELTADGKKCRVRSPTWWVEYTDHAGTRRQARGFKSREATLQLAARLERTAAAVRSGSETPEPATGARYMVDYLAEYREYRARKCRSESHVRESVAYVRQAIVGAGLTTAGTVKLAQIQGWLDREKVRTGKGKKPWSQRTYNHRVTKLKAFGNWLVKKTDGAKANPFEGLETANAEVDRKHIRRALEHPELLRLIATARGSTKTVFGLTGPDRAMLYLFAAYTGFRCKALASLTTRSLEWVDGLPAVVTVMARWSKNGKSHSVPFHPDIGRELAGWLATRSAGATLWPGSGWPKKGAKMLRHDLERARAAYLEAAGADAAERARREASDVLLYRDAAGEVFDFHSLRVQFISGLARSGVSQMAATKLADHSDPRLTAVVYARFGKGLAAEVAKLPGLGFPDVG